MGARADPPVLVSGDSVTEDAPADDTGSRSRVLAVAFTELVSRQATGARADQRAATAQQYSKDTHDRNNTHRLPPAVLISGLSTPRSRVHSVGRCDRFRAAGLARRTGGARLPAICETAEGGG